MSKLAELPTVGIERCIHIEELEYAVRIESR